MTAKNQSLSNIFAPVSLGELVDKITILEIKKEHMTGEKLKNVDQELQSLKLILKEKNLDVEICFLKNLKEVNSVLWVIEDNIRIKESKKEFDKEFIELARSVYKQNDKRALIKKEINLKYNSNLIEEKSYEGY